MSVKKILVLPMLLSLAFVGCKNAENNTEDIVEEAVLQNEIDESVDQPEVVVSKEEVEEPLEVVEGTISQEEMDDLFDKALANEITVNFKKYYDGREVPGEFDTFSFESYLGVSSFEDSFYRINRECDLDNDGLNELIIEDGLTTMFFDVRDNEVYEMYSSGGTAEVLGYQTVNGKTFLYYCNYLHEGYSSYDCFVINGKGEKIDEKSFYSEASELDSTEHFYVDGKEVTPSKYEELMDNPFGF